MPQNKYSDEKGNVFVIILIAVALFALLMFTFARTGSQGTGNLTKQQAKIAAQEILNYARLVEGAVNRVRLNGCSESEISFENSVEGGYINAAAPGDNTCHIFDKAGGKLEWSEASQYTSDNSEWLISPAIAIAKVGSDSAANSCTANSCTDLVMFLGPIESNVCTNINSLAEAPTTTAEAMAGYGAKFTGAYTRTDQLGDAPTTYRGVTTACLDGNSAPAGLYFYHVLLARQADYI